MDQTKALKDYATFFVKKSKICDQITGVWKDWSENPDRVVADVQLKFKGQQLIVRSSTLEEDGWETANAGVFESILDIDGHNITPLFDLDTPPIPFSNPVNVATVLLQQLFFDEK